MINVGKGIITEGPGFDYAIVDKNYTAPTDMNAGKDEISAFTPGVRFISAANSVKVRGTRNVQSYLVEILPRNSRVLLVEEKDGWGKIEFHGTSGWVKLDYLRTLQDSDLARTDARLFELGYLPEYQVDFFYVNAHSLNVRYAPNFDAKSVQQLPRGERMIVLDTIGLGWVEVRTARGT